MRHYPLTEKLVTIYFNQDYDLIGNTTSDLIRQCIEDHPSLDLCALSDELRALRTQFGSEGELGDALSQLGCDVRPLEGQSYQEWIDHILTLLDVK